MGDQPPLFISHVMKFIHMDDGHFSFTWLHPSVHRISFRNHMGMIIIWGFVSLIGNLYVFLFTFQFSFSSLLFPLPPTFSILGFVPLVHNFPFPFPKLTLSCDWFIFIFVQALYFSLKNWRVILTINDYQ
jgi:hypothetical protein